MIRSSLLAAAIALPQIALCFSRPGIFSQVAR